MKNRRNGAYICQNFLSKISEEPKSNVYVKGSEDHYNTSFVLKLSYIRKKLYDFKNKQQ